MSKSQRISAHISYGEGVRSQTAARRGLDNTPDEKQRDNMRMVGIVFEAIRKLLGNKSITISSFFRSPAVNKALGGSATSAHCHGCAIDLDGFRGGNVDAFGIMARKMDDNGGLRGIDQLIGEFFVDVANDGSVSFRAEGDAGWIHLGIADKPRDQVLLAFRVSKVFAVRHLLRKRTRYCFCAAPYDRQAIKKAVVASVRDLRKNTLGSFLLSILLPA